MLDSPLDPLPHTGEVEVEPKPNTSKPNTQSKFELRQANSPNNKVNVTKLTKYLLKYIKTLMQITTIHPRDQRSISSLEQNKNVQVH